MAAYTQTAQQHQQGSPQSPFIRSYPRKQRFVLDLSKCLFDFVIQLLPTTEEMAVKEDVRKLLERLIRTIEPDSRLLSFGSTANGFSLRNSDMDLCCLIDSDERLAATDLVTMLGDLLERETKFHVKPLPHARVPIVKLSLDPSPGLPLGIACDIGFENRLALENTRLLMCYAMIDPTRVRTMVLFLKVWSKRRKINSPYQGTLSSYGYVLLVIYFLVHVKNPPVLPNLQQMPPLRPIPKEDHHVGIYNTWFFDDIELLRQRWQSSNVETVAELLIDFFRYYSRDFSYNTGVASIRAGLLKKESKGWQNDLTGGRYNDARERNRLCIEDPFEIDFNVGRCVTKDGLYTIRGEFMRASRILSARPERAVIALAQLCEERKEEELVRAVSTTSTPATTPSASTMAFVPPRLSPLPPQTPYTVGSSPMRPKGAPAPERLSPNPQFFEPSVASSSASGSAQVSLKAPQAPVPTLPTPEHMAPKRGAFTSPPPPEAPQEDIALFENSFGRSLQLATSSTNARERERMRQHDTDGGISSESNSEILTDEDRRSDAAESDDVRSVQSFTEGAHPHPGVQNTGTRRPPSSHSTHHVIHAPSAVVMDAQLRPSLSARGRLASRLTDRAADITPTPSPRFGLDHGASSSRSLSGPPRMLNRYSWSANTPLALSTPLPPSPMEQPQDSNIFYETNRTKSSRPFALYAPGHTLMHSPMHSPQQHYHSPVRDAPSMDPWSSIHVTRNAGIVTSDSNNNFGSNSPLVGAHRLYPDNSFNINSPIIGAPPRSQYTHSPSTPSASSPHIPNFSPKPGFNSNHGLPIPTQSHQQPHSHQRPNANARSRAHSPPPHLSRKPASHVHERVPARARGSGSASPFASTTNSNGSASPTPSSTGYCTSVSLSPASTSPPSPSDHGDPPNMLYGVGVPGLRAKDVQAGKAQQHLLPPSTLQGLRSVSGVMSELRLER